MYEMQIEVRVRPQGEQMVVIFGRRGSGDRDVGRFSLA